MPTRCLIKFETTYLNLKDDEYLNYDNFGTYLIGKEITFPNYVSMLLFRYFP